MQIGVKHGNPDTQKLVQTVVFTTTFFSTLIALLFLFLEPHDAPIPTLFIVPLFNLLYFFLYTRFTFPYVSSIGASLLSVLRSSALTFLVSLPLWLKSFRGSTLYYAYLVVVVLVNFHHIYILLLAVDFKVGVQMLGTV